MKTLMSTALALSLAILVMGAQPAGACSCIGNPPEIMFADADAVFRGTPTTYVVIDAPNDYYQYYFSVTDCWKGNVGETVILRALVDENICGIFIEPGQEVIVYAYFQGGSELWTNLCSVRAGNNQEHLNYLGEPGCSPVSAEEHSWGGVKALYR